MADFVFIRPEQSNAVLSHHARHFEGNIPSAGAIVGFRQHVAVDIHHSELMVSSSKRNDEDHPVPGREQLIRRILGQSYA